MSTDEYEGVTDLDFIAEEFEIPFLAELVANNERVTVNTDHLTGWIEEDGERFFVIPHLDFLPLDNDAGFQLRIAHVNLDEDGRARATISTFLKGDEDGDYLVKLDEDDGIAEEEKVLSKDEEREELPVFRRVALCWQHRKRAN